MGNNNSNVPLISNDLSINKQQQYVVPTYHHPTTKEGFQISQKMTLRDFVLCCNPGKRDFVLSPKLSTSALQTVRRKYSKNGYKIYTLVTLRKKAIVTTQQARYTSYRQEALYQILSDYNLQDITSIIIAYVSTAIDVCRSEREILSNLHHPYITSTHYALQRESNIYLMMDHFDAHQTLRDELRNRHTVEFEEKRVIFYAAEIYLAIEYCHKQNIILRDLIPEHILICNDGHIKLTDMNVSQETLLINNTHIMHHFEDNNSAYIAPEVLSRTNCNEMADWWSFGVILYEMIVGIVPFKDQRAILYSNAPFYEFMSRHSVDLLSRMLVKDPSERIAPNYIRVHCLFQSVEWRKVYNKEITRPLTKIEQMVHDIDEYDGFCEYDASLKPRHTAILLGGSDY